MKVCHVLHSLQLGGAEMLVARMADAYDTDELTVMCLDELGALGPGLQSKGVIVRTLERRAGIDWRLVGNVREALREMKPDVVHTHQYTPYFYGGWAAAREGLPFVFTEHGRHQPDHPRWRRVLFNRWLVPRTSAITAVSQSVRTALVANEKIPASQINVVYNGVDEAQFHANARTRQQVRSALELSDQTIAIGTAGRLVGVKNQKLLLDSLGILQRAGLDFVAYLVGEGPLEQDLKRQCRGLGLEGRVRFLGPRNDVAQLLNAWDIFVLSSFSEGTSVTLLEAMSTGLPVAATRVGGNPELIEDGVQGLLTPTEDVAALAEALARLASDRELRTRMGAAGRERVLQQFRQRDMLESFRKIYRKVVTS